MACGGAQWRAVALNTSADVAVLFVAGASEGRLPCPACSHFTPYFRRVAERFAELAVPTLTLALVDLSSTAPPPELALGALPALLMLPADDKGPPFRFYTGPGRVLPVMEWIAEHCAHPVRLPVLPQFNEEDRRLYKEQLTAREQERARRRAAAKDGL